MGIKKKAIIITDGSKPVRMTALFIKETLTDYKVKICSPKKFAGTDLLPVDAFFIGSKKQRVKNFAYLEELLAHINLASRKCGIFGLNDKAIKYLKTLTNDCEADIKDLLLNIEDSLSNANKSAIKKWLSGF